MKKNSGVYTIENTMTCKFYVGASTDLYNRLCMHKYKLRAGIHHNDHLQKSFNKYGEQCFIFDTLEECDDQYIYSQENYWCNMLNVHDRKHGYNIDPTSPNGKTSISEETKLKMSNSANKRTVVVYTIYGEYYNTFSDLYKCAEHFNTVAPNIHRKMNVKFFKKNLIDSESSKFIFLDEEESVEEVIAYWNSMFNQIKLQNGKYEVYDCFNRYIGKINSRELTNVLNINIKSISTAIKRNTYLRTLKIKR